MHANGEYDFIAEKSAFSAKFSDPPNGGTMEIMLVFLRTVQVRASGTTKKAWRPNLATKKLRKNVASR